VLEHAELTRMVFPGSFPNRKSYLGVVPAIVFFALACASSRTHQWGSDCGPLVYLWASCGLALVAISVGGYRGIRVDEKSVETTFIMFCWACADVTLGLAFVLGRYLPNETWLGIGYACFTVMLMHLGTVLAVWDVMTGILGAFAKAMTTAMGAAALIAAAFVSFALATPSFYA
jgi:hypothetical protein